MTFRHVLNLLERRTKTVRFSTVFYAVQKLFEDFIDKNYKRWVQDFLDDNPGDMGLVGKDGSKYREEVLKNLHRKYMYELFDVNPFEAPEEVTDTQIYIQISEPLIGLRFGDYAAEDIFNHFSKFPWDSFFKKYGYYLSTSEKTADLLELLAHANYDKEIKVPRFVYHTTDIRNKNKILREGLKAFNHNKLTKDLPRIYVALTMKGLEFIAKSFSTKWFKTQALFRIDTTKLRRGTKWHEDMDYHTDGAWTYTNIPPKAIEYIGEFTDLQEGIPKKNKDGDCYQKALRYMESHHSSTLRLVHGLVDGQGALKGITYNHAWVEDGDNIIDMTLPKELQKALNKTIYYALGNIKTVCRYTHEEMREKVLEEGTYGPWEDKLKRNRY